MARGKGRKKQYRRRRRRGGAGVLVTLICLILILAAILVAVTIFFRIREIRVTGDTRYTEEQIIESSQLQPGDNMFFFNKFAVISRIFADCPYLDEISIRRQLPDVLEITVKDCVPVAAIADGSSYYVLDVNGKILEKCGEEEVAGYCKIQGATLKNPEIGEKAEFEQEDQQIPLFSVLNTAQNHDILQDIGEIDISEIYNISFQYTDRFTVKIGTVEDLDQKLSYMKVIIEEKLDETTRGVIDISDVQVARFIPQY